MTSMQASTWARMTPTFNQHMPPVRGTDGTVAAMTGVTAIAPVGLLAHQGGWDEILLVAGPIVLIVAALWVVKRRVDRMPPPE